MTWFSKPCSSFYTSSQDAIKAHLGSMALKLNHVFTRIRPWGQHGHSQNLKATKTHVLYHSQNSNFNSIQWKWNWKVQYLVDDIAVGVANDAVLNHMASGPPRAHRLLPLLLRLTEHAANNGHRRRTRQPHNPNRARRSPKWRHDCRDCGGGLQLPGPTR